MDLTRMSTGHDTTDERAQEEATGSDKSKDRGGSSSNEDDFEFGQRSASTKTEKEGERW